MSVGTSYEQWRVAEHTRGAIEARIAKIGALDSSSLAVLDELLVLRRAHIKAIRRADELWAHHREELEIAMRDEG